MTTMRIAHVPINVAGFASRLAIGQRMLGHAAVVFSRPTPPYNFPADVWLPAATDPIRWNLALLKKLPELATFDVLHVHGGIFRSQVFYQLFKRVTDAKIVIHYHGTETRRGTGLHHQDIADRFLYTPPDLAPMLPANSVWIPQPIVLQDIRPYIPNMEYRRNGMRVIFVHFVSSTANKGTSRVIRTFERAFGPLTFTRERPERYVGKGAELRVYRQIPREQVLKAMCEADVVFDQYVSLGIYGTISVEAMALGKPVFASIDYSLYPAGCPVQFPSPEILLALALSPDWREELAQRGHKYVTRVHEASVVAKKVIECYQ